MWYFGGRFPGKKALDLIVASWKVEVSIHHHLSGWMIFEFYEEDTKTKVIQGGNIIFGRPILLKTMSKFFSIEEEELSFGSS